MASNIIYDGKDDINILADIIRYSTELGADIIKVNLPKNKITDGDRKLLFQVIENSPPVVLAGGSEFKNFEKVLSLAKDLGFSGVCIGRNIFLSDDPIEVLNQIDLIFNNK